MGNPLAIDAGREVTRIVAFIQRVVRKARANGVVLGLSGGVDSAVTGALCVKALGKKRVTALLLPSDHTPDADVEDAEGLASAWGIRTRKVGITPLAKALSTASGAHLDRIASGNIQARVRMALLYAVANSENLLVAGTGDRSEEMLGFFCYDSKTRVVTVEGPRGMNELRVGDKVFSLDPESRQIVQTRVEKLFSFDYNGKMIHFRSRGDDLMVTPNHRMLVQTSSSKPNSRAIMRTAEECMKLKKTLVPLPTRWAGEEGLPLTIELRFKQRHIDRIVQIPIQEALYLFGLFIGDGCAVRGRAIVPVKSGLSRLGYAMMPRDKAGRFVLVPIRMREAHMKEYDTFETIFALPSYTKEGARGKLIETLTKHQIGYSLTRDTVRISSRGIYELFAQCGIGARNKHIPQWVMGYSSEYLIWLLRGLKDSDGSHAEDQNVFYTSSERLKDDFVQLCYKLGRRATVRIRGPRSPVIRGKTIRTGRNYEISFAIRGRLQHIISSKMVTKVDYSGKVWCPSVPPFENILVERNGRYIFSGNTKWGDGGVDFLPIAHLYKTQVRALGEHLNLPKKIVEKPASPQLWPGHTALEELPEDYGKLDYVLHYLLDRKLGPKGAATESGLDPRVVRKVLAMNRRSAHKRRMPPSLLRGSQEIRLIAAKD